MGDKSEIQWTDATWNPIRGCSRVSEGCRNCYAETAAIRQSGTRLRNPSLRKDGRPHSAVIEAMAYRGLVKSTPAGPRWTGEVRFVEEALDAPLRWKAPRRIFVNSMSDLFHEKVREEWLDRIVGMMGAVDRHVYQVLTKRPQRMREYVEDWQRRVQAPWPKHIWLGVSVENQAAADERIPLLLQTPAAVRFLSVEPLLGPVDLFPWLACEHCQSCGRAYHEVWSAPNETWNRVVGGEGGLRCPPCFTAEATPLGLYPAVTVHGKVPALDWIIVGGESGPGARPCDLAWIRSVVQQAQAAGVPVLREAARRGADRGTDAAP